MHTLSALLLSKIVIAIILVALLYNLFQAVKYGIVLASRLRCKIEVLSEHQKYAKRCFWIVLLAVAVIEPTVRYNHPVYDFLFWIHLCIFAIPCFILLALIRFKYTGLKRPDVHAKLIYWGLLPALIGTLFTGLPLLYRL